MKRPYVTINVAMTADGKIDTFERQGASISSPADKARVDRLRAEADAVLVGGRTLLDEDPKLTVRSQALQAERQAQGLPPHPAKVGIVTRAVLPPQGDFLNAGPARRVIFTTPATPPAQLAWLQSRGVEVFLHAGPRVDLLQALQTLQSLGIERLVVEGGATLNFELLRLGQVDQLTIYLAPLIFGGESAPTLAAGPGLVRDAARPLTLLRAEAWEDGGVLLHYQCQTT